MIARTTNNKTALNTPTIHQLRRHARHVESQFIRQAFLAMIIKRNFSNFKTVTNPEEGC